MLGRLSLLIHTSTYTQEGPVGCDYDLEFPSLYEEEGEKFISSQDHWLDEGLPKELNIFIQRAQKTNRQKTQLFLYTRLVLLTIMHGVIGDEEDKTSSHIQNRRKLYVSLSDIFLKGTVSRDEFWFLMTYMVSFRPK